MLDSVSPYGGADAAGSSAVIAQESARRADNVSSNSDDGATLVAAKPGKKKSDVFRHAYNAGRAVVHQCVDATHTAKKRVRKKVGQAAHRLEDACLGAGVRALETLAPALKNMPALKDATVFADPAAIQARQQINAGIEELRAEKKCLKKVPDMLKAARKKLGRLTGAASARRMEARSHLEKDSAYLCKALPALALGQARKESGHAGGMLQAAMQRGREAIGLGSGASAEEATKAIERLWEHGLEEARADNIGRALDKLRGSMDLGGSPKTAIGVCRALLEQGRATAREAHPDPAQWQQAVQAFGAEHLDHWRAVQAEKKTLDGLPNPRRDSWITDLSDALGLIGPSSAEIKQFIKCHVSRSLHELSDNAFDDVCRTVAPGGYLGTLLVQTDRARSADVLDAWRQATDEERVRRYETEPLHAFAELTELIEANATQGMSDTGLHANEVPLPEQSDIYVKAQDAMHRLLRGMCLSTRGNEARTEYLSRLIFERATPEDRAKLLDNTTWRAPDAIPGREPPVFQALMDGVLRITHNAELMGPQYKRLLQEMRVVLEGKALASPADRTNAGWREPADFDKLQGALPGKTRSGLRRAWDKVRFWSGYFVFSGTAEMEAKRFAYHQAHVDKRLGVLVNLLSHDAVEPRTVRRAYRDFLDVADDLRAEFGARQFRDTACDDYLRLAFSHTVGGLAPTAIKNLYKYLQQPCPDMTRRAPRLPAFAGLQAWWRNKFVDEYRAMPRDSVQWQRTASRCWTELRAAAEREPEARCYAFQLERLASRFGRDRGKDYAGMKAALDGIIQSDGNTWSSPSEGSFTAYDAAWARIRPEWRQNLLGRLARYETHMDDFLKADAVKNTIAEENLFLYRYFLEGLHASGKVFVQRNPMDRYADSRDATAPAETGQADEAPASTAAPAPASAAVPSTSAA
ncbi:hypothetical protein AKI39_23015 [Bordetella sp. H567]|uniref:hypothetical protein n=1 Tax=Bordetella sp. H567 TaxID=1697043 RepID=UPI00081C38D6|nr:hypothetical protein [Bordetella sp. H567]AOB32999.1 hypothetical protein AKI39_23015 [Bordetella sp. H567]